MDKRNIALLYKKHVNEIFRYSRFKLKSTEEAEDITSEVFSRLVAVDDLESIQNIRAWLYTVARNLIINKYKSSSYRNSTSAETEVYDMEQDKGIDIENNILQEHLIEIIKTKVDLMEDKTSEVIILRVWEQCKFDEIAIIIGEKVNTVKQRFYRGIEKIKYELNSSYGYSNNKNDYLEKNIYAIKFSRSFILPDKLEKDFPKNLENLVSGNKNNSLVNDISGLIQIKPIQLFLILVTLILFLSSGYLFLSNYIKKGYGNLPFEKDSQNDENQKPVILETFESDLAPEVKNMSLFWDKNIPEVYFEYNKDNWVIVDSSISLKSDNKILIELVNKQTGSRLLFPFEYKQKEYVGELKTNCVKNINSFRIGNQLGRLNNYFFNEEYDLEIFNSYSNGIYIAVDDLFLDRYMESEAFKQNEIKLPNSYPVSYSSQDYFPSDYVDFTCFKSDEYIFSSLTKAYKDSSSADSSQYFVLKDVFTNETDENILSEIDKIVGSLYDWSNEIKVLVPSYLYDSQITYVYKYEDFFKSNSFLKNDVDVYNYFVSDSIDTYWYYKGLAWDEPLVIPPDRFLKESHYDLEVLKMKELNEFPFKEPNIYLNERYLPSKTEIKEAEKIHRCLDDKNKVEFTTNGIAIVFLCKPYTDYYSDNESTKTIHSLGFILDRFEKTLNNFSKVDKTIFVDLKGRCIDSESFGIIQETSFGSIEDKNIFNMCGGFFNSDLINSIQKRVLPLNMEASLFENIEFYVSGSYFINMPREVLPNSNCEKIMETKKGLKQYVLSINENDKDKFFSNSQNYFTNNSVWKLCDELKSNDYEASVSYYISKNNEYVEVISNINDNIVLKYIPGFLN